MELDDPRAFLKVILTDPWRFPWMTSGIRSVFRLPNWESRENQLSNNALTSRVRVEPDAVQPETEPQLGSTLGVVLNCRVISVTERAVDDDVMRMFRPGCESLTAR